MSIAYLNIRRETEDTSCFYDPAEDLVDTSRNSRGITASWEARAHVAFANAGNLRRRGRDRVRGSRHNLSAECVCLLPHCVFLGTAGATADGQS